MIIIKSNREIELMKEAGRIVALAHRKVAEAIAPGVSTYELDKIAEKTIRDCGAKPSFIKKDSRGLSWVAAGNPGFHRLVPVTSGSFSACL